MNSVKITAMQLLLARESYTKLINDLEAMLQGYVSWGKIKIAEKHNMLLVTVPYECTFGVPVLDFALHVEKHYKMDEESFEALSVI